MQFDKLEAYFEKQGYNTVIKDGTAPFRRLIVSKQHIGEEFYENEWNKLSKEEQVAELEDITNQGRKLIRGKKNETK